MASVVNLGDHHDSTGRLDENRNRHGASAARGRRAGPTIAAGHRDLDRDRAVTAPVTKPGRDWRN
jgi:hypothetical protein